MSQFPFLPGTVAIGKSALAEEFARRQLANFSFVWWVRADSEENFVADLLELARALAFFDPNEIATGGERTRVVQNLFKSLSEEASIRGWLLIFQNIQEDVAKKYLSEVPVKGGTILLTSIVRTLLDNEPGPMVESSLEIPTFSLEDAITFLRGKSGISDLRESDCEMLVNDFGRFPLTLIQLANTARHRKLGTDESMESFRASIISGHGEASVAGAILFTLTEISKKTDGPDAMKLLQKLVHLAPENVPKVLVFENNEAARILLENYSIISINADGSMSIHQYLRSVVHTVLYPKTPETLIQGCVSQEDCVKGLRKKMVELLASRREGDQQDEKMKFLRGLLRHAEALRAKCEDLKLLDDETAKFLRLYGLALGEVGNPEKQLVVLRRTLQLFKNNSTKNAEEICYCHEDYGDACKSLYESPQAITSYTAALKQLEELCLPTDSTHYTSRRATLDAKLGSAYYYDGKTTEAIEHLQRFTDTLSLRTLGNCDRLLGNFSRAEKHLLDARQKLKEESPDFAKTDNDLGYLFLDKQEYDRAQEYFESALSKRLRLFGEKNLDVATTKSNLAFVHTRLGNFTKAEKYLNESVEFYEQKFSRSDKRLAHVVFYRGCSHLGQGRIKEAIKDLMDAQRRFSDQYGEKNAECGVVQLELGKAYLQQKKISQARSSLKLAREIFDIAYSDKTHPNLRDCDNSINSLQEKGPNALDRRFTSFAGSEADHLAGASEADHLDEAPKIAAIEGEIASLKAKAEVLRLTNANNGQITTLVALATMLVATVILTF